MSAESHRHGGLMKAMGIVFAALVAGAMVVGCLWAWDQAQDLVLDWGVQRPDVALWAVRSLAVAGIAVAQMILMVLVCGPIYRKGTFDAVVRFASAAVAALAAVSAVACGLAGR